MHEEKCSFPDSVFMIIMLKFLALTKILSTLQNPVITISCALTIMKAFVGVNDSQNKQ
jgi:hypothetical protein